MKLHVIAAAALMAVMSSTAVNAQSLKDKEYFAAQEKDLAEQVPSVNKKCDTKIDVKFDWSKPPTPAERDSYSASGYCESVLSAVRSVCEKSQAAKDAVKAKIKSLICGFGPERTIALKQGAIDYKINWKSSNDYDFVYEYLMNNL